jgi:hypothetical protein
MKSFCLLSTAILLTSLAHAQQPVKPEPYSLKNRSSFSLSLDGRVPFWPIGWQRPKEGEPVRPVQAAQVASVVPKVQLSAESFNVTSVLLGNPSLATINGRSFEEGEYLPVRSGDQRLKVQVRAIREQGVWVQLDNNQPILIPIRRNELRPRLAPQQGPAEWSIQLNAPAAPKPAVPVTQ